MPAQSIPVGSYGLTFSDLYRREGLLVLDRHFLSVLRVDDAQLHDELVRARAEHAALTQQQESGLLLQLVPHLERFIARLFGVEAEVEAIAARHHELTPLYAVKRQFVQRKATHAYSAQQAEALVGRELDC